LENLKVNHFDCVKIWDKDTDFGYQLLGKKQKRKDPAALDGYAPNKETIHPILKISKELAVGIPIPTVKKRKTNTVSCIPNSCLPYSD
jgi:hypothetical protein